MHKLRQKASGRRVRYQSEGGFDLDLSYITDRVIAMPIPSEQKLTSLLKNNISEVARFLDQLHANHYRLYNLCLEGKYDYEKFKGRVSEYQYQREGAPTLSLVVNFVNDACDWLESHPRNVCVVHCDNGKGRTGTMVSCLLLKTGVCSTPSEALQLFANRRTTDGKVVVKHPSQLRYVSLYDQLRKGLLLFKHTNTNTNNNNTNNNHNKNGTNSSNGEVLSEEIDVLTIDGRGIGDASIEKNIPRIITGIRMSSAPQFRRRGGGCDPWFSIDQKGKRIFFSPPIKGVKSTESVYFSSLRIFVSGDIRLDFYHKNFKTKMFSCSLHTAAFRVSAISLPKRELDIAWKDKNNKHFPQNFKLEIFLAAAPDFDESSTTATETHSGDHGGINGAEWGGGERDLEESRGGGGGKGGMGVNTNEKIRASAFFNNTTSGNNGGNGNVNGNNNSSSNNSKNSTPRASTNNGALTGVLTRMRASAQLEAVSVIGTRCARCREVLGAQDFYLEVSGVSIHWDCLQCNECGRVFGEAVDGARDSCVLMREGGGVGCVHCGDFRNFFPACARCGEPVTAEGDCCVSVPAATTYWHSACFACVRCAAPLLFTDEDALWRIEPTTGMPICFFHPTLSPSSSVSSMVQLAPPRAKQEEEEEQELIPPPPSPASGFFGLPPDPPPQRSSPPLSQLPKPRRSQQQSQVSLSHSSQSPQPLPLQSQRSQSNLFLHQRAQPQPQILHAESHQSQSLPNHTEPHPQTHSQQSPRQSEHSEHLPRDIQKSRVPSHTYSAASAAIASPATSPPSVRLPTSPASPPSVRVPTSPTSPHSRPNSVPTSTIAQSLGGRCKGCSKEVEEGSEVLSVAGGMWHPGCLQCAHCHTVLSQSQRVTAVAGKLYCRDDFEKLFGVTCGRCRGLIEPGTGYFNTGTNQFHVECFSCSVCNLVLTEGGTFFVRNDVPLCEIHKHHSPTTPHRNTVSQDSTSHQPRDNNTHNYHVASLPPMPPTINNMDNNSVVGHHRDSGEAICHSVAALISTAKEVLLAKEDFDKKTFVTLAKQLAATGREYTTHCSTDTQQPPTHHHHDDETAGNFNKSHEDLVSFCVLQLQKHPPQGGAVSPPFVRTVSPTCESLNASRAFLLALSK